MQDFFFYLFSAIAVISSLAVVLNRNAVSGAMFMILTFVGVAGLFVLLNAFFLAILQILVYAGAIMVLFLFIIMLLDVDAVARRLPGRISVLASVAGAALAVFGLVGAIGGKYVLRAPELSAPPSLPSAEAPLAFATSLNAYGYSLFTKYMLPFQLTGLLLLIAMVGVIVLSKRYEPQGEQAQKK